MVEIDIKGGLYDFLEVYVGDVAYSQVLGYISVPFHYPRCHKYEHIA